jgi:hypothetical protein
MHSAQPATDECMTSRRVGLQQVVGSKIDEDTAELSESVCIPVLIKTTFGCINLGESSTETLLTG